MGNLEGDLKGEFKGYLSKLQMEHEGGLFWFFRTWHRSLIGLVHHLKLESRLILGHCIYHVNKLKALKVDHKNSFEQFWNTTLFREILKRHLFLVLATARFVNIVFFWLDNPRAGEDVFSLRTVFHSSVTRSLRLSSETLVSLMAFRNRFSSAFFSVQFEYWSDWWIKHPLGQWYPIEQWILYHCIQGRDQQANSSKQQRVQCNRLCVCVHTVKRVLSAACNATQHWLWLHSKRQR